MRGSLRTWAWMAAVSGALAAPAAASAAQIAVDRPCYAEQQPMGISGTGFTPGAPVRLTFSDGRPAGQATADGAGNLVAGAVAPKISRSQATGAVTAVDQANPANLATIPVQVSKLKVTTSPTRARPHAKVTYSARGFTTGQTLYGHYLFGGKRRKDVRIGGLTAPCGTLKRRMSLLPVKRELFGTWTVQFDTSPTYSPKTVPAVRGQLSIFHRPTKH
jgi:hypothetical protein